MESGLVSECVVHLRCRVVQYCTMRHIEPQTATLRESALLAIHVYCSDGSLRRRRRPL